MRKYTFLVSLVAHVGVIAAVLLTTLVVTHTLPGVRPVWEIVIVSPDLPTPAPLPSGHPQVLVTPVGTIPIETPDAVLPESDVPRVADDQPVTGADGLRSVSGNPFGNGTGDDVVGPPPPPPAPVVPQRVGGSIVPPGKLHHVPPVYPSLALAVRVQGIVILDAVVGEDGAVRELRILRSIPLLDQAALDAVRQWRYTPTLLNGRPTPVIMTVTVSFNLN